MNILRRIGLGASAFVFSSGLSLFAVLLGAVMVFGTPDVLKGALRGSGLYSVLLQSFLMSQTTRTPMGNDASSQILADALTPMFAQQAIEGLIDSTYDWARGKTSTLSFEQTEASLTNAVAATLQQKVTALPPCSDASPAPISPEDVLALTCLPPGVSSATIAESVERQLITSDNHVAEGTAWQENDLANQLAYVPALYQIAQVAVYIVPIVIVLCALGIVFWSVTKRSGAKRVAWILITVGSLQTIVVGLGAWLLHQAAIQTTADSVTLRGGLLSFFDGIMSHLMIWWVGAGIAYVVVGIIILFILYLVNRRQKPILSEPTEKHEHIDLNTIK